MLGSNQRPPACRAGALPTELTARGPRGYQGVIALRAREAPGANRGGTQFAVAGTAADDGLMPSPREATCNLSHASDSPWSQHAGDRGHPTLDHSRVPNQGDDRNGTGGRALSGARAESSSLRRSLRRADGWRLRNGSVPQSVPCLPRAALERGEAVPATDVPRLRTHLGRRPPRLHAPPCGTRAPLRLRPLRAETPSYGGKAAAAYLSSYFVTGKKGEEALQNSVRSRALPRSIVHLSPGSLKRWLQDGRTALPPVRVAGGVLLRHFRNYEETRAAAVAKQADPKAQAIDALRALRAPP